MTTPNKRPSLEERTADDWFHSDELDSETDPQDYANRRVRQELEALREALDKIHYWNEEQRTEDMRWLDVQAIIKDFLK